MMSPMLGKIFIVLTWGLFLLSNYITVIILLGRWFSVTRAFTSSCQYFYCSYTLTGRLFFISYEFLIILTLICHLRAVFGDPGKTKSLVPATPPPGFISPHFCNLCGSRWKPPRAHHCRKCQTCVFRMDHHCTWIDNCVGITNQKFFILFLIYTAFLCFYQLFLLFLAFLSWIWYRPFTYCFSSTVYLIILLLESLVFLYITTYVEMPYNETSFLLPAKDFLCEQIESLETNSTLVESHQHTHGVRKSLSVTLFEVFGERSFFWCLPTFPKLQVDYSEPIFLTKSAALQLRLKKHRQLNRKKRVMEDNPNLNVLIPSSHIKLIKGANDHYLLDPKSPTMEEHKGALRTTVSNRGGSLAKRDASNTVYQDFLHCDQLYRNMHIKPSSDIGVHFDDDSDFISLNSLQSDEYATTEHSLN